MSLSPREAKLHKGEGVRTRTGRGGVGTTATASKQPQQQQQSSPGSSSDNESIGHLLKQREDANGKAGELYERVNRMKAVKTRGERENVFLFVPNLIGYTRIILAAIALTYMPHHPNVCTWLYCLSCLLDAVDGKAARYLDQTSKFGAVLDMVTDRCTTSCLLSFLVRSYPRWTLLFQFLITLDFASHYIHMHSSLTTGQSSHKIVSGNVSQILRLYYNNQNILFIFCAGNELFFVALYLLSFKPVPDPATCYLYIPQTIVRNAKDGLALNFPQLLAIVTGPICLAKQIVNMVQFWKASKVLVGVDLMEREARRK